MYRFHRIGECSNFEAVGEKYLTQYESFHCKCLKTDVNSFFEEVWQSAAEAKGIEGSYVN